MGSIFSCISKRSGVPLFQSGGYGNGYVIISKSHPLYGSHYDDTHFPHLDVHGGITWADDELPVSDVEFIGPKPDSIDGYWVLGFDTCHHGDNLTNWDREAVIKETVNLQKQLEDFQYDDKHK